MEELSELLLKECQDIKNIIFGYFWDLVAAETHYCKTLSMRTELQYFHYDTQYYFDHIPQILSFDLVNSNVNWSGCLRWDTLKQCIEIWNWTTYQELTFLPNCVCLDIFSDRLINKMRRNLDCWCEVNPNLRLSPRYLSRRQNVATIIDTAQGIGLNHNDWPYSNKFGRW